MDFWRREVKKIAIIGDYNQNEESHCLIMESIKEAAEEIQGELKAQWIMSDALDVFREHLKLFDGFWCLWDVLDFFFPDREPRACQSSARGFRARYKDGADLFSQPFTSMGMISVSCCTTKSISPRFPGVPFGTA